MEDRAARIFASLPYTACHLPHSSASSSAKRGLCGSSWDLQCRVDPPHALGSGLTETRAEAVLADPGAAVPDVAARAGATASDAVGSVDDPSTLAVVSVVVTAAVIAAVAHPALSVVAAVSIAAARAGVPVSATVAISVTATRESAPISIAAISTITVGAPSVADTLDADASPAGSSSTSSSRSITSLGGGTPGAAPCPAGSVAEAEGGTGVGSCPVPDCGTPPLVAATEAVSAGGPAASPMTLPLAAGGVTARPTEVVDT
ncbi:hormone receptor 4-like [Setaria italica]|uniref:hormone receptor 4-like n=1 Tax=Setaria italica TaxID=4555 RepID=UPI000350EA25|nr:hormone receptor 4-like [Setaria italica]